MKMKYGQIAGSSWVNTAIYRCFDHVTEADARKFVKKFAEQPHHQPQVMHTFRELILGAFLCQEGLPARYDVMTDGQTPDWSVMDSDVKGIVELVNFHIDKTTEEEIRVSMTNRGKWAGWRGSNEERLYSRLWEKSGTYKELRQRRNIPYAVAVFGCFDAAVSFEEVQACVAHPEHGLFGMYHDLSGVLFIDENLGRNRFRYLPNPEAERPWALPCGGIDLWL